MNNSFLFSEYLFPKNITELDKYASHVLSYGAELDANHPVSLLILANSLRTMFECSLGLLLE